MLSQFELHLRNSFPSIFNEKVLIAISGGVDSMVLANLCLKLDLKISLAHCNFNLRGSESKSDEDFIFDYGKSNDLIVYSKHFNTELYAKKSKLSTQMAARKLRYHWFENLINEHKFDRLLTAHHSDDNLETFFINLIRGSGIEGLSGIPKTNVSIARPLLIFSKEQILNYANQFDVKWREDSTNGSLKYHRNELRHKLIPVLKKIHPKILESLAKTQSNIEASKNLLNLHIEDINKKVIKKIFDDEIHYSISALKSLKSTKLYLFPLFKKFGFSDWEELYNLLDAQSGKQIFSVSHTLIKDREVLILTQKKSKTNVEQIIISKNETVSVKEFGYKLKFKKVFKTEGNHAKSIFVDMDKLKFPLKLRNWISGDSFYPKGMKGKKKISKFLKDEKLSLTSKSKILLLCSDSKVVWVVGKRQDARFVPSKETSVIYKISIVCQ